MIKDINICIEIPLGLEIANGILDIIASPCSIELEDHIMKTAREVKNTGATMLRDGVFKPRSSFHSFQGMEIEGLKLLRKAGNCYNIPIITREMDHDDISPISEYTDILQIGARNCQNYTLLKKTRQI